MANFLGVFDPVKQRHRDYVDICKHKIKIFDNLEFGTFSVDNFSLQWAISGNAPINTWKNTDEGITIFGDAIRPGSKERITARQLKKDWNDIQNAKNHYYDGYYCAIRYSKKKGLIIGGDLLGLFPIYYFKNDEITLAGSSPELFKYHPCFKPEICIEGLTGIMLMMHGVGGLSLWKNVYRLKIGHLLFDEPEKQLEEIKQFQILFTNKYYEISFDQQVEIAYQKMGEAVERHAPSDQPCAFLFSGGLDTRMLAGYLKNRNNITAITLGKSSDYEMRIAKKVIRHLPFHHQTFNIPLDKFREFARLTAQWEHGLHGFNTIQNWNFNEIAKHTKPSRIVSGIVHDAFFAAEYRNTLGVNLNPCEIFEKIFKIRNRWGIAVSDLEDLIRAPYSKSIGVVQRKIWEDYLTHGDSNSTKNLLSHVNNRARFHQGGAIWKMSFGAWPVIPVIDSAVLEFMAGLPFSTKSGRRLQRALVSNYFPELARLHLDNNSYHPEPLLPTWQFLLFKSLTRNDLANRIFNKAKTIFYGSKKDKLYYYRIYDINNEGWKAVRNLAEPSRSLTNPFFDQEKLQQLVPAPSQEIDADIADASGIKTLLGFMLWLKNN